jgi:AcrR family transcriptional regulator
MSGSAPALFTGKPVRSPREAGRGPGRPSPAVSALRNEELLDHALDLFLEHGFAATTIEAISSAIGMSRRTIYARYGDKDTLFRAALQRAIDEWIVPVAELRAAESARLEDTLLGIARLWLANIRRPSGWRLVRIAYTEAFVRPEVALYLRAQMGAGTIDYVTDLLRRRLRDGDPVPDAEDAAAAFMILIVEGSIQSVVWESPDDAEFSRNLAYRVNLFLNGARKGQGLPE